MTARAQSVFFYKLNKFKKPCWHFEPHEYSKMRRVIYRSKDNDLRKEQIKKIIWWSLPVVYPSYQDDMNLAENERQKYYHRVSRWKKYVEGMAEEFGNENIYFATFTFSNVDTTSRETKTQYIQKWLKTCTKDYFCCMDIGAKNGREHFHAIIVPNFEVVTETYTTKNGREKTKFSADEPNLWVKGFWNLKKINTSSEDLFSSTRYILKTTSYAVKNAKDNGIKPFHARGVKHERSALLSVFDDFENEMKNVVSYWQI